MIRTTLVAGLLLPLVAAAAPGPVAAAHPGTRHRVAVTGYALGGSGAGVVAASAAALTTFTVDGVSITGDGSRVARPDASMTAVERAAHERGLRAELLVSNFSNDLGDFDPDAAHGLLGNADHVSRLAATLAGYVARGHWDGVNVDLELVPTGDAGGLVRLVKALQAAMPARKTVSIDVSASTSPRDYRAQGYALAALARSVDVLQLMAYDQHGPTWSGPGPIGDLRWQRRALHTVLSAVPAARVDLGVAGYGYTWPDSGTGHTVTDRGARALVAQDGADAVWHADSGEWSAHLSDGTDLWWSDARSYRQRVVLAARLGLHGLAVWRLGSADPLR